MSQAKTAASDVESRRHRLFSQGTWSTWRVDTYVRKVAFLRKQLSGPLATLYRIARASPRQIFRALT